jgi:nicotinamide-nucleotide amidase
MQMTNRFQLHRPRRRPGFLLAAVILLASWLNPVLARDGFAPTTDSGALEYFLVITGGEVLEGVYADAHTSFVTRSLLPLGCRCVGSLIIDDEPDDLVRALEFASAQAQLVIVTGGLGPTPNDVTRESVATFLDVELREDPELLAFLERRFGQPRDQLRPNVRRQALIPDGGSFLPNPHGTSAGIIYPGNPPVVALPGPPRELQPMVRDALIPYLQERFGVRPPGSTATLRFVGAGQSLISQTLDDHALLPDQVTVGTHFEGGRVDFTFSLPGRSPDDLRQLKELTTAIRRHLGQYLYATDESSLEDVVVAAFLDRGASLAIAEIGSGGLIAAALHAGRRAEQLLIGTLAAPSMQQLEVFLPPPGSDAHVEGSAIERAKQLARQTGQKLGASWVIVSVPDPHPDTATPRILIALSMPGKDWATTHLTPPAPDAASRYRFSTQLLDWLRRELGRHP